MENVDFYNTKKPIIRMSYEESGQKRFREENFNIMHAQNISPSTGFNIDYKARGTRGQYVWSRTKNHNLAVAFNHTGKRYSVHAAYYNNHIEQQENGGVVGVGGPCVTRSFEMPSGVPMKLSEAEAENTHHNNAFFVTQSYAIRCSGSPTATSRWPTFREPSMSATRSSKFRGESTIYTDNNVPHTDERDHRDAAGQRVGRNTTTYDNWFINPTTRRATLDRLRANLISNGFRAGAVGPQQGGGNDRCRRVDSIYPTYSQFEFGRLPFGALYERKKTASSPMARSMEDKEIRRLRSEHQVLPVEIARRREHKHRRHLALTGPPRTPLILEPALDGPAIAITGRRICSRIT